MRSLDSRQARQAFTLIELLVVIAIIAILIALLVPAVQKVREASARSQCANNLKQMSLAVLAFNDVYKALPTSRRDNNYTWYIEILPFVDQTPLQAQWTMNSGNFYTQNTTARMTTLPLFFCPSRRPMMTSKIPEPEQGGTLTADGALADYACNVGTSGSDYWWNTPTNGTGAANTPNDGPFRLDNNWSGIGGPTYVGGVKIAQISDGMSNTLMLGEKHAQAAHFGDYNYSDGPAYNGDSGHSSRGAGPGRTIARGPTDTVTDRFGSWHPSICQFALCDGTVRPLPVSIDSTVLGYLANKADGQSVTLP
jgi:prepilin-type N-terminal cleavage/methylation domain-containing protein